MIDKCMYWRAHQLPDDEWVTKSDDVDKLIEQYENKIRDLEETVEKLSRASSYISKLSGHLTEGQWAYLEKITQ